MISDLIDVSLGI